ncbi:hypothetical protein ACFQZC_08740 [Streptacidiphilus monticola]
MHRPDGGSRTRPRGDQITLTGRIRKVENGTTLGRAWSLITLDLPDGATLTSVLGAHRRVTLLPDLPDAGCPARN